MKSFLVNLLKYVLPLQVIVVNVSITQKLNVV